LLRSWSENNDNVADQRRLRTIPFCRGSHCQSSGRSLGYDPQACDVAENSGDVGPGVFAGDKMTYFESECTITKISPIGEREPASVWRVETACSGEGENWTKDSVFAIERDANGIARQLVEIEMNEGYVVVLQACK
jgi:hypothetical protein